MMVSMMNAMVYNGDLTFPTNKNGIFFSPQNSWPVEVYHAEGAGQRGLSKSVGLQDWLLVCGHVRGWQRPTKKDAEFGKVRMSWIFSAFYIFYLSRLLYNHQ
jgi:hypothetical protein